MIFYNISTKIDPQLADAWLEWYKQEHIPEIMATGCFESYRLFRLLDQDDRDGLTYVIQFRTGNLSQYKSFCGKYEPGFNRQAAEKWGDHYVCYRTSMELVQ